MSRYLLSHVLELLRENHTSSKFKNGRHNVFERGQRNIYSESEYVLQ